MSASEFALVRRDEQARAFETLVSAFTDDPVERWLYPETEQYLRHFPAFLEAFGGRAFDAKTVWRLGDFQAVAMWMPPGIGPDGDTIATVLRESVVPAKHEDTFSVLDQMDAAHPKSSHWYLPWFGVDRAMQGKGFGSRLMEHSLGTVDASHLPAYLETPNPRNISFYERHGFVVTGMARAGTCPPIAMMLRETQM